MMRCHHTTTGPEESRVMNALSFPRQVTVSELHRVAAGWFAGHGFAAMSGVFGRLSAGQQHARPRSRSPRSLPAAAASDKPPPGAWRR